MKKSRAREAKSKIKTWTELKKHMDKRFLPPSYWQELYLKVTSVNQEYQKMEEYIREFEQLQIRVGLNEEPKVKIAIHSLRGYLLALLKRWIDNLTYPLRMCAT